MCGLAVEAAEAPPPRAPAKPLCPRCSWPVDPGAAFCGVCGLPAGEAVPATTAEPALPPTGAVAAVPPMMAAPVLPAPPVLAAPVLPAPPILSAPALKSSPPSVVPAVGDKASLLGSPVDAREDRRTDNFGAQPGSDVPQLVTILKDGSEGPVHRLTTPVTDIGRYEGNITLPDDPYLSPRHARIGRRNDRYYLRDLGSVNGIYHRLREPVELHHGDVILVGQQVLRLEILSDVETSLGPVMHYGVMLFGTPEQPRLARLVQLTSEGIPRDVFHLYREETVIGRESGDLVFTDDVFLSRRHAALRLERTQRRVIVRDLGSSNGTLVLFRGEREIVDGDLFRIGHHLFRFDASARGGARSGTR
jgi:pSer/pThr/pTyr-binding forkhead associated (FHA) protein